MFSNKFALFEGTKVSIRDAHQYETLKYQSHLGDVLGWRHTSRLEFREAFTL